MNQESREERYLRILTSGVQSELDYEDAKYLIDKGYADGKYSISKGHDSYGKVCKVAWVGVTSEGLDLADELRARTDHYKPPTVNGYESNECTNTNPKIINQNISPLISIAIGVAILVLFGMVAHIFNKEFGVNLM